MAVIGCSCEVVMSVISVDSNVQNAHTHSVPTDMERLLLAPLVKIKQAVLRTRQETVQMDIRIGLLQHILLRQTLVAKQHLRENVAAY